MSPQNGDCNSTGEGILLRAEQALVEDTAMVGDRGPVRMDCMMRPDWLLPGMAVSGLFYDTWYPTRVRAIFPNEAIEVLWAKEFSRTNLSVAEVSPRDGSSTAMPNAATSGEEKHRARANVTAAE